ncbi:MAG: hypothetical protein GEU73_13770 [Chloroflexi bacterium]|nr:hypothetical protein [Chloroflexota bacterium]
MLHPLEGLSRQPISAPDGADPTPPDHVRQLFQRQPRRRECLARRDLDDARLVDILHPLEVEKPGVALALRPPDQRHSGQIVDVVAAIDGELERVEPALVC